MAQWANSIILPVFEDESARMLSCIDTKYIDANTLHSIVKVIDIGRTSISVVESAGVYKDANNIYYTLP